MVKQYVLVSLYLLKLELITNMLKNILNNFKQKSLLQRFLFFVGFIFLLLYFALGCIFIIWKDMPLTLSYTRRIIFGSILIVYSIIRFFIILIKIFFLIFF